MTTTDYFNTGTPCIGFVAKSGTGKTQLLENVIARFHQIGIRIAVIKHTHHDFDIDQPGKDSYRLRQAGAQQTLIVGPNRWALIKEHPHADHENDLHTAIQQLNHRCIDCILIEGFKGIDYPKIELHRVELNHTHLYLTDPSIIAIASNQPAWPKCPLTVLDINQYEDVCQFIIDTFSLKSTL